jgi:hypothetical protein
LAVKVACDAHDEIPVGAIVRCIDFRPRLCRLPGKDEIRPVWTVEFRGEVRDASDGLYWCCSDSHLRPIRDIPGEDEMLSIARKNAHDSALTEQQERLTRLLEEVPKQ